MAEKWWLGGTCVDCGSICTKTAQRCNKCNILHRSTTPWIEKQRSESVRKAKSMGSSLWWNSETGRKFCGSAHPGYVDGKSLENDKYPNEYYRMRNRILKRDGYKCTTCSNEEALHVHHIDRDPTNNEPSNLITLCEDCHLKYHTEKQYGRRKLA